MGETINKLQSCQEIVHDGWLIKSPPTKLWKARWRERWFVLRNVGGPTGQHFLEYYADEHCKKLKGRIDLDQCEQVDAGLSFVKGKEKYQFLFQVLTPKRTYYLVAENEADMNKWVNVICQVCGLKWVRPEEEPQYHFFPYVPQDSPPNSPSDIISGPYIPISECISGSHLKDTSFLTCDVNNATALYKNSLKNDNNLPPQVNWETFPSLSDLKPVFRVNNVTFTTFPSRRSYGKISEIDTPPRPPKPQKITPDAPGHNYLNLDGATESSKPTTPVTPTTATALTEISIKVADNSENNNPNAENHIFKYDFPNNYQEESSFSSTNSNPSSPTKNDNKSPPIYRDLKPKTRINIRGSHEPPSPNRKLKPPLKKFVIEDEFRENTFDRKRSNCHRTRHSSTSEEEDFFNNERNTNFDFNDNSPPNYSHQMQTLMQMQYLDLDLHATGKNLVPSAQIPSSGTVYKTVDFLKTEKLLLTKQRVEKERKQCSDNQ